MENAGEREWEMKQKNFRKDDPLYPCNTHPVVEDRFKPECYINHHGYLIRHYSQSWDALVEVCLGADAFVESCLGGLALMLGGEYWLDVVAEGFDHLAHADRAERVTFLCGRLPDEYASLCYSYVIPSFLNFGHDDLTLVSRVCELADEQYRVLCFERAGEYLDNLVASASEKWASCATVPEEYRDICMGGSREVGDSVDDVTMGVDDSDTTAYQIFRAIRSFFAYVLHLFARPAPVSAESVEDGSLFSKVQECLGRATGRGGCYASLCEYEPGYMCADAMLTEVVRHDGPETGMQILEEMIATPVFSFDVANEGHSLAHVIGRSTARIHGGSGESFLRCPTSLDYGCQHGFLEYALPDAESPAAAVTAICESLPEIPTIGRPNCYHGSGHGVMMNASYHFADALAVCEQTPDPFSCYTGVTMENATAFVSGAIQNQYPENNSFREDNPLAPCDTLVDSSQRRACYRQHMPYLAEYFDYQVQDVADACLSAGNRTDIEDCAAGFGAYGIYDGIQESFLPGFGGDYMDKIIHMCNHFPEEHRMTCYAPVIDASTVFYWVERASDFCYKIDEKYLRRCFWEIGARLQSLVVDRSEAERECSVVPDEYRGECLDPRNREEFMRDEGAYDGDGSVDVTGVIEREEHSVFYTIKRFFVDTVAQFLVMFARPVSAQSGGGVDPPQMSEEDVARCLSLEHGMDACFATLCAYEPGYVCAEEVLAVVTPLAGAERGMEVLRILADGSAFQFDLSVAHLLAHIVGRETARQFGLVGDAFLTCPIDFDYGCYHGFLEAGFLEGYEPAALITEMCESMPTVPAYAPVACYHGSGHALVMHYSYGLYEPLEQCDMLISYDWQDACWSGVFMENVNGVIGLKIGDEPDNGFRDGNPFAPCDTLEEKYKVRCYENLLPYWIENLRYTFDDLINLCFTIEEGYIGECIHTIGAYSIYPGNQDALVGSDFAGNSIDKTIYTCRRFPDEYRMRCLAPAIQQSFTYYGVEYIAEFCGKIGEQYRVECWQIIGHDLAGKVSDDEIVRTCSKVPKKYQSICLDPRDEGRAEELMSLPVGEDAEYEVHHAERRAAFLVEFGRKLFAVFEYVRGAVASLM